ncbi:MAG: Tim44 domain-containing protein [Alphaproteobacteria bacterium]|nr:Tim44 domain-containing protein [Alphaproteobacteria bacterium]
MSDGFQYFDIILFAMVAAFLVLRLRSVLGRRTGTERPRDYLGRFGAKREPNTQDNVVNLPDRARLQDQEDLTPPANTARPTSVAAGIAQIRSADPGFDTKAFTGGARSAFEMIVHAFASGDTTTLRPLLSDEVYERFAEAIRHRVDAKETHETNLVSIKSADIEEAELNGRTAFVTMKFVSDQVNVTRAADGQIVDGEPDHVVEKTDFWTFARNTRSQDPNWLLVATRSA